MFTYRTVLDSFTPYQVDEQEWDIKLDANENCCNLPPLVRERLMNQFDYLAFQQYPDAGVRELRSLIADSLSLKAENVLIGNGSSDLLEKLCFVFGGEGRGIVIPAPSFSMYGIYATLTDSKPLIVRLNEDYSLEREKLLQAADDNQANLIIVCNPNNPTGTVVPFEDIEYIVKNAKCPVVIDEAYHEFYGEKSAVTLLNKYNNVIVAKTFSKAYSLASARVGYILAGEKIIDLLNRAIKPYNVNALSLLSAEVVYQMRHEFLPGISSIVSERKRLQTELEKFPDITVYPSAANFLLFKVSDAASLNKYLKEKRILIRDFSAAPGLEGCMRVTIGTPLENDAFLKVVQAFYEKG
ncbi:MAG: histidinol-phosphate transaminase [Pelosinus sp.]|nr:histidinol-phosphate transaminase [Pelosinus sp.]